MAALKVYVLLFAAFLFSGLVRLSAAQEAQARVIDGKTIDQAVAYLLMLVALFVTYFPH